MKKLIFLSFLLMFCNKTLSQEILLETSQDTSYNNAFAKLKYLFIVQMHSPEYQKRRALSIEYRRKLHASPKFGPGIIPKDEGALDWLKENWQTTLFSSYEEAEKEWAEIVQAHKASNKANLEYREFYTNTVLKYGPEIFTDMFFEVMAEYPDKY